MIPDFDIAIGGGRLIGIDERKGYGTYDITTNKWKGYGTYDIVINGRKGYQTYDITISVEECVICDISGGERNFVISQSQSGRGELIAIAGGGG